MDADRGRRSPQQVSRVRLTAALLVAVPGLLPGIGSSSVGLTPLALAPSALAPSALAPSPASPPSPAAQLRPAPAVRPVGPPAGEIPRLTPPYPEAAAALRRRDCDRAISLLDPLAGSEPEAAQFARVVQGLYAHACEQVESARMALSSAATTRTVLEDWRLLALADSAAALGEIPVARRALDQALGESRSSPLYPLAIEKAVRIAREAGDLSRALALVERVQPLAGDESSLPQDTLTRLDEWVWQIGGELGDDAIRRRAARRLLTRDPAKARDLDVATVFRAADGTISWSAVLTAADLMSRARALSRADRHDAALEALQAVPGAKRDVEWRWLYAEVLTEAGRGGEALRALAGVKPEDARQASRLEWQRALAARDLAAVRRGRINLPTAERERWLRLSRQHLRRVADLDGDPELSRTALRRLFQDLADGNFELALGILQRLRAVDPEDATGADFLWGRGWEAFQSRNYSTAIGYWAELASLYPDHRNARSGRYWTGRSWEALGHRTRARGLYREMAAADTTDFYRRYALDRLAPESPPGPAGLRVPGQEPAPWPEDARLARVRLLSDLGLDDLALAELDGWRRRDAAAETFDLRASHALESEVLQRKGELRASIGPIRQAFPSLGGPYQSGVPERALRLYYPLAYHEAVRAQAERYDLPQHLLLGMIRQESAFDRMARSRAGARGLLQLMPATGREVANRIGLRYSYGRLTDPAFNLRLGAAYFRQVLSMFDDQVEIALAGYNGGPYRIKRLWNDAGRRDPDRFLEGLSISESRIYVKRILVLSDSYRQLYDLSSASAGSAVSSVSR